MLRFQFYWLRRMIRNNTDPIPEETALRWKKRLSVAYALIAWNAFGIIIYQSFNGKADWAAYHGLKTEEELKMTPGNIYSIMSLIFVYILHKIYIDIIFSTTMVSSFEGR